MKVLVMNGREAVYDSHARMVVMPGRDGEFSVLDFHQPFLYRLRSGTIKVRRGEGDEHEDRIPVVDGLARFNDNSLLILCEM